MVKQSWIELLSNCQFWESEGAQFPINISISGQIWHMTESYLNANFNQQGQVGAKLVHSQVGEQSMCQIVNNGLPKVRFLSNWENMGQGKIIQRLVKWQKHPSNNCKKKRSSHQNSIGIQRHIISFWLLRIIWSHCCVSQINLPIFVSVQSLG